MSYYTANKAKIIARVTAWQKANPEKVRAKGRRSNLKKFGLTVEKFNEMLAAQGGGCAICWGGTGGKGRGRLHAVDHDHVTGRVRGLLCHSCNVALGLFKDDPALLALAAAYLRRG